MAAAVIPSARCPPGGEQLRDFCCVLPEAVLDTATNERIRLFLIQFFQIKAVISLPYDAFRPFTSTKTCILFARKRPAAEVEAWSEKWARTAKALKGSATKEIFSRVVSELGWNKDPIFMAEPKQIGYKRRKNLPDLIIANDLYFVEQDDVPCRDWREDRPSVLGALTRGEYSANDSRFGFWTSLDKIGLRHGFRLDPKYRWLWDFQGGVICGERSRSVCLNTAIEIVELPTVPAGELQEATSVIDLEYVESRQAITRKSAVPTLDSIESTKVSFRGADLVISRLEPYLGKIILKPPACAIGTPEWVGLKVKDDLPIHVAAYLLMLPETCEAFRRLQSGKRHARLKPEEMLELKIELPPRQRWPEIDANLRRLRYRLLKARIKVRRERADIDHVFDGIRTLPISPT